MQPALKQTIFNSKEYSASLSSDIQVDRRIRGLPQPEKKLEY